MIALLAAALVALAPADEPPQPPTPEQLAAIAARGRDLAAYDQAAGRASDAVQARNPPPGRVDGHFARKTAKGWTVAFGRLDDSQGQYLVAYEATQGAKPDQFAVAAFDPPKPDVGFYRAAARASALALKDFAANPPAEQRPYNVAVLPADRGQLWVYLVPAPTKPGVWPLGGDVRYLVAADGTKVESRRQLHKTIIENKPPEGKDQQQAAGIHNHVLAMIPEDTDVFHVLTRKPPLAELIVTRSFVFVVEPDGTVRSMGKPEDLFRR